MDPLDAPAAELDHVEADAEALRGIERDLAVGLETEATGAGRGTLPDVDERFGRGRNIHVLGVLDRGVGNAGCTADQDQSMAQALQD